MSILIAIGLILFGMALLYLSFSYPGNFNVLTSRSNNGWLDTIVGGAGSILIGIGIMTKVIPAGILKPGTFSLIGMVLLIHCHLSKRKEKIIDTSNMGWTVSLIGGIGLILLSIFQMINYIFK